jgi:nuclear pore complex protein Nup210
VKNDQDLRLLLNVRDANGRLFDNITSLYITWSSSDKRLAGFVGPAKSVQMMFIREGENEDVRRSVCEWK